MPVTFRETPESILARLGAWRAADAPTHGGRILAYVFDTGVAELDGLVAEATRAMLPVNGLDPTTFTSVAHLEREVVAFIKEVLHGGADVVGSATTGGTESNLLAVKTARDAWLADPTRPPGSRPRLVLPVTAHGTFRKAAQYFGLAADVVPVRADGSVSAHAVAARLADDVALVVASAQAYPFGVLDPVADVAAAAAERGVPCHVDACMGGLTLPFWPDAAALPAWDFRVPGVTSIAADLHKFGFAPKGVSVLLQRGRDHQRRQHFACADWAGYPLVNPTMLGSKSGMALAAAWAIIQALGVAGFEELTGQVARASADLRAAVTGIEGLRVFGDPTGPMIAAAADPDAAPERRVDPHHWADALRPLGWTVQMQPGLVQADGVALPATTHLTVTPVTESRLPDLLPALGAAADAVRGVPPVDGQALLARLRLPSVATSGSAAAAQGTNLGTRSPGPTGALGGGTAVGGPLDSESAWSLLQAIGLGSTDDDTLPGQQAPLLALIEALPADVAERLLIEKLARLVES
ncbi:MAG: aminotransferase class V-fold PLP-dependent enzyme [Propionibacteriaceae bacterium]|nr:aminotransferase class V-fold PLP-dependent enzyme [Propionibacteriaceae bacterium]